MFTDKIPPTKSFDLDAGDEVYEEEEKHMIEMSSILQKFSRFGPLKWEEVNSATAKVMAELQRLDPDLFSHLTRVLDIRSIVKH